MSSIIAFGQELSPKQRAVFNEIAYHRLKVGEYEKINKWVTPVVYKIIGDTSGYIVDEIDKTFNDLAKLTKLTIRKTNDDDANFMIYLSQKGEIPNDLSSNLMKFANANGGYYYRTNRNSEMVRFESLFILSKYRFKISARYVIKKGITKGMGFFKPSKAAPSSIFYVESNDKLKFDDFDSAIISAFYNQRIKPGMTREEVDALIK